MSVALDRYIVTTPDIRGGKPHVAASRITVAEIVLMYLQLGQSLEEIAGRYDLSLASVYAAMAYYYNHQATINDTIAQDRAAAEAFRSNNASPLQAKLQSLKHG